MILLIEILEKQLEFIEYATKKQVNLNDFDQSRMTNI